MKKALLEIRIAEDRTPDDRIFCDFSAEYGIDAY